MQRLQLTLRSKFMQILVVNTVLIADGCPNNAASNSSTCWQVQQQQRLLGHRLTDDHSDRSLNNTIDDHTYQQFITVDPYYLSFPIISHYSILSPISDSKSTANHWCLVALFSLLSTTNHHWSTCSIKIHQQFQYVSVDITIDSLSPTLRTVRSRHSPWRPELLHVGVLSFNMFQHPWVRSQAWIFKTMGWPGIAMMRG